MRAFRKFVWLALSVMATAFVASSSARTETIESALTRAYEENPQLNAQRASVRATDEYVPQALSGYRPRVGAVATVGEQRADLIDVTTTPGNPPVYTPLGTTATPYSYGVTVTQNVFNGFQTANRTRAAESQVMAAREGLRVLEQTILLNGATIYMDVLRDTAVLQIQQDNVATLRQVFEQTQKRFSVGDVTATDVSQAKAQLASAEATLLAAGANLATSSANYRTIIGVDPHALAPASPVDRFSPPNLIGAFTLGDQDNPNITAGMYGVDVAHLQVKINEGALYPTMNIQAAFQQQYQPLPGEQSLFTAGVTGQLSIPLYQGGAEYALIRQSKESAAQQRLNLDLVRRQVHASVAQAWAQLAAAKGELEKAKIAVAAAEATLNGMRKEARVGERTTFDVLNAQQVLVTARITLVTAQHDRVVTSYNLLSAVGRLSPKVLALPTTLYDPGVHYQQVRDAWSGLRTPSGK
jgi:outer membrane protein